MRKRIMLWLARHKGKLLMGLILVPAVASIAIGFLTPDGPKVHEENFSTIETAIQDKKVTEAVINDGRHRIKVKFADGTWHEAKFVAEAGDELQERLRSTGTSYEVESGGFNWVDILTLFGFAIVLALVMFGDQISRLRGKKGKKTYLAEQPSERFPDIKGNDEAVAECALIVKLLKHPEDYEGLQIERGILFYGPTGTGKTLLARAVAGEAGVPFYQTAGAGLTSRWANGTAERIGEFFAQLREDLGKDKKTSAVVFIDEVDGIGSKRTGEDHADRDTNISVTQLLDQLGRMLKDCPNVVVIAATNRKESLDEALLRPGRLGKHIAMPNPDSAARRHILELNSREGDRDAVDLESVASLSNGLSGAVIARIPHEAAVLAHLEGGAGSPVTHKHLERAAMQIVIGTLRPSAVVVTEDDLVVRVHESGHSTVAQASPFHQLLATTSIPSHDSGGSTWMPMYDRGILTEGAVKWILAAAMGGREAEKLDCGEASTGASHDISHATDVALAAVCQWGLFGFTMAVDVDSWVMHPLADKIGEKVEFLLNEASAKAREVLEEWTDFRRAIQHQLKRNRILYSGELAQLALENQPVRET